MQACEYGSPLVECMQRPAHVIQVSAEEEHAEQGAPRSSVRQVPVVKGHTQYVRHRVGMYEEHPLPATRSSRRQLLTAAVAAAAGIASMHGE